MEQPLDLKVREEAFRYLRGDISLQAFREWLIDVSWDIPPGSQPEEKIAGDIELLFAERDHGDWTDAEFNEQLYAIAQMYQFSRPANQIGSTARNIIEGKPVPFIRSRLVQSDLALAGTESSTEYV